MNLAEEIKAILIHVLGPDGQKLKDVEIARALCIRPPTLNQYLSGAARCPGPRLAQIVEKFVPGDRGTQVATLRKLLLILDQERVSYEDQEKWTDSTRSLALEALSLTEEPATPSIAKSSGRTMADFPNSFYPLAIVSGDKREDSEARISHADFGAVSASPAESRWLLSLGLRRDVPFFGDKIFVREPYAKLKARFGSTHLMVIGSPGANHLARRLHLFQPPPGWRRGVPLFRFNVYSHFLSDTEADLLSHSKLTRKQLVGEKDNPKTASLLKLRLRSLFTGGILDPTSEGLWIRASHIPGNRDFGLIGFARNPFSDDDRFVCILVAGFHMFGTAHAIRMLGHPESFQRHPLGGVFRVDFDDDLEFGEKFDSSTSTWDTDSEYTGEQLAAGLRTLQSVVRTKNRPDLQITAEETTEAVEFVERL